MYPLDDNNLDRLSAEAAEHYHAPGNPSWESLEQVLDIELPQKKEKKRRGLFFFFLFTGLFISGAGFWYYRTPAPSSAIARSKGNTIPAAVTTAANTNNASTGSLATGATVPEAAVHANTKTVLPTTGKPRAGNPGAAALPAATSDNTTTTGSTGKKAANTIEQPSVTPGTAGSQLIVTNASHQTKTKKSRTILTAANAPAPAGNTLAKRNNTGVATGKKNTATSAPSGKKTGQPAITDTETGGDITAADPAGTSTAQKNNPPVTTVTGLSPAQDKSLAPAADATMNKKTAASTAAGQPETAKTNPGKKKKTSSKAFSIGLTGGVDISTVKFSYANNLGYNIGLLGGYHFNNNWSVYTGAVYTKKNYKLNGYNYSSPYPPAPNYELETVDGYCRMWEVPVLGRYTFNSRKTTHWFVSTGLSSYFMQQEHYNYNYKLWGVSGSRSWTNNAGSNYWFSILDLSAGLEKQLGSHLSAQVEPYAKLPLAGLGTGKIQLSSFGINLTLQYKKKIGK